MMIILFIITATVINRIRRLALRLVGYHCGGGLAFSLENYQKRYPPQKTVMSPVISTKNILRMQSDTARPNIG